MNARQHEDWPQAQFAADMAASAMPSPSRWRFLAGNSAG